MSTDFRLYHGNDLELLAGILAGQIARPVAGRGLLEPDTVLIPQPAMRRWLQKTLAERHGIAANLQFLAPGEFVRAALDANVAGAGDAAVGDAANLRWRLWALLDDAQAMAEPVFAPLQRVLGRRTDGRIDASAAWALAGELAQAFEKYQAWRRDWLRRWDQGADRDDWQAELWRRATWHLSHRGKRLDAYLSRLDAQPDWRPAGLPPRVFAFATQNVSPDVLRMIASAARGGELHFFFLSPVQDWWGDLVTARERLHADPQSVFADAENPLLRANGAAGRDFVRLLFSYDVVHPTFELPKYEAPDPLTRTGLLHSLQRDLLARRPVPQASLLEPLRHFTSAGSDGSLQVHSCHTRLREIQVLHEQLRVLLENDPALQPREIAVLTPDMDEYATHVHAVFGGGDAALPCLPYALGDVTPVAARPTFEAFARLLALPTSTFAVNDVLELLAVPVIAAKFQLDDAAFGELREWLGEAGARWGIDAAHRAAQDAPSEAAYTWTWALDRLLLGHASGSSDDLLGVAPWPQLEGSALASLDALLQGLHKLALYQRLLAGPYNARQWQALLSQMIDALFTAHPDAPADRLAIAALRGHVAAFAKQVQAAGVDAALPLAVVQDWFAAVLSDGNTRQPMLSGGITFGRMVPMRLVPFKVICLLGMNDGQFPRREPAGSINRLSAELGSARQQVGDRSIRDEDRGLFLQLFAAATQTFYVSYLGQDPRSGEDKPPSVVVSELLDVAAAYHSDAGHARKHLTVREPLQPFAAEAFGYGDGRRLSYQRAWRAAVDAAMGVRRALPAFVGDAAIAHGASPVPGVASATGSSLAAASNAVPSMHAAPGQFTRDQLFRALSHAPREFLSQRVGLQLPREGSRLPDSEPFDARDGLHRYALHAAVFDAAVADAAVDARQLARRLLAQARIAPGAAGEQEVQIMLDEMSAALAAWRQWGSDSPRVLPYRLQFDGQVLSGRLQRVHASGLRQFSASKAHGKTVLGLGIDALIWSALGNSLPVQRIVNGNPPLVLAAMSPAQAHARLQTLLQLASRSRETLLPFMPKAGYEYFLHAGDAGWSKAGKRWADEHGEGKDAWVQLALRGHDPFDHPDCAVGVAFRQLSMAVFGALPGTAVVEPDDE